MAIKFVSVQEAIEDNGLKALVHGPAGVGKTVLGATAKAPTLVISAESGLLSLGQDKLNLQSIGSPDFDPSFCTVVEIKTLDELSEVFDELELETDEDGDYVDRHFDWLILDSITEIAEVVLKHELSQSKDPRKAYGNLQNTMLALLKSFRDLPEYNVLMTCKQVRSTDDTSGVTSYQPMMPGAKLTQQIPYLFDEVWCLRVGMDEENEPFHYIQATRELQYEAKDRSGKLTDCEPPSLAKLYKKIKGELKPKKKSKVVEEVEEEQFEEVESEVGVDATNEKVKKAITEIEAEDPDELEELDDDLEG